MQSKIVLTNDFESLKNTLLSQFNPNSLRFFEYDDFLIDNARDVIAEAYIAESAPKILVVMAKNFRHEAQNSLLKIIEEPPHNIFFLIATVSKNMLLPTIRSRLILENRLEKVKRVKSGLNIKKMELRDIISFIEDKILLEQTDKIGKNELKELVAAICCEILESDIKLDENELEYIYKITYLCELNAKPHAILTPLLMMIYEKGQR